MISSNLNSNKMNIEKYLRRIESEHLRDVSLENLKQLQANHLRLVAFENLDMMANRHVAMDLESTYEKVILKHRGGFCFELNQLFGWLLQQLGYNCVYIGCRVYSITLLTYSPWFSHIALLIHLENEGNFLADVGFSMSFQNTLAIMPNVIQKDTFGYMKIVPDDCNNDCFTLLRNVKETNIEWNTVYQFNLKPKEINSFKEMLQWVQSPACPRFYNRSMAIRYANGYMIMLVGFRFTKICFTNGYEVTRIDEMLTKEQVFESFKKDFFLNLDFEFEPKDIN